MAIEFQVKYSTPLSFMIFIFNLARSDGKMINDGLSCPFYFKIISSTEKLINERKLYSI